MSIRILPSIAAADSLNLKAALEKMDKYVHIDIEDGNFVPNITFGMKTVGAICRAAENREIDVHLLVNKPENYIETLAELGISSVCAHIEALPYPLLFLNRARSFGMKAGIAVNISTPLSAVREIRKELDYLLLMTAEPDNNGCRLYHPALLRALETAATWSVPVIADGGLDMEAVSKLEESGAWAAVLGRNFIMEEE